MRAEVERPASAPDKERPLTMAVSAMTSPRQTLRYYDQIALAISTDLDRPVQLVQRRTYQEVNDLLRTGQVDVAFICSGAYVAAREEFDLDLLAIPQINGRTTYRSYIIAGPGVEGERFDDLKGRSFAFTDPLSNTGYLYPMSRLADSGESAEVFFTETRFTHAHDYSIRAVRLGTVDAAAVESPVFEFMRKSAPEELAGIRVIEISPEYGMPPVVAPASLAIEERVALRRVLLRMHGDSLGRAALSALHIDRFREGDPAAYDGIPALPGS